MKRVAIAALLALLAMLGACAPGESQSPPPSPSETPEISPEPTVEPAVEPTVAPEADAYYALILDGETYTVDLPFASEKLFAEGEYIENPADSFWPASRFYETETMSAQTFLQEDGSEKLISLATWKDGETPAGIRVGSTLEELKAAYPDELFFLSGIYDMGYEWPEVPYDRMYLGYQPDDQTNRSYHFYLKDKKVVMIEVLDGLDMPRAWHDYDDAPLGMEELCWEYLSGGSIHYFLDREDGTEETVLNVSGITEHHDLDGDGLAEILVYLDNGAARNIGVYDMVDGEMVYVDVNQTLGSAWSSYMGNVGNLPNTQYRTCIYAGMEVGQSGEVYSYADGALTLACTFEEAMTPPSVG